MNCKTCHVPVAPTFTGYVADQCSSCSYRTGDGMEKEAIELALQMDVSLRIDAAGAIIAVPPEGWRFRGVFRKNLIVRRYWWRSKFKQWHLLHSHLLFGLRRTQ